MILKQFTNDQKTVFVPRQFVKLAEQKHRTQPR